MTFVLRGKRKFPEVELFLQDEISIRSDLMVCAHRLQAFALSAERRQPQLPLFVQLVGVAGLGSVERNLLAEAPMVGGRPGFAVQRLERCAGQLRARLRHFPTKPILPAKTEQLYQGNQGQPLQNERGKHH